MIRPQTGRVYAEYHAVGADSLRITVTDPENRQDYVVTVAFPTPSTMVWIRGQRSQNWEFTRSEKVIDLARRLYQANPGLEQQYPDPYKFVDDWIKAHPDQSKLLQ